MLEPSIWDYVDPLVLPRESSATLDRFDEEKRIALDRCRALGYAEDAVERAFAAVWPSYLDDWLSEETGRACGLLSRYVSGAGLGSLCLSSN